MFFSSGALILAKVMELGGADDKNLFFRHVDSQVEKDELGFFERAGYGVGIFFGLIVIAFFLVHLGRPTGFFTEEFGSLAAFLFFAPMVVTMVHQIGRAIVGRQNILRPMEAGNNALSLVSVAYLFALFPFDFSHFAEPFPRFLEFTISWINNAVARFVMVVMMIAFAAMSIYIPILNIHVGRALNHQKSGI